MKIDRKTAEKNEKIVLELSRKEENSYCCDCGQKGVRWASATIGCFLCINCAGMHRRLGTHISKIKSLTLDSWTDKEIEGMVRGGNRSVNGCYLAGGEERPCPKEPKDMERYIKEKYEMKLFQKRKEARGEQYGSEVSVLGEMGFSDSDRARRALLRTEGNVEEAISILVEDTKEAPLESKLADVFDGGADEEHTEERDVWEEVQTEDQEGPAERRERFEGETLFDDEENPWM
ncbi:MAG: ArfGap-domain-containing protein [Amphiamblys sp. WSBS2006]|nr:MAG: ArfGap-domain-containing protein [Amphiamblys sp. WSBS2006]